MLCGNAAGLASTKVELGPKVQEYVLRGERKRSSIGSIGQEQERTSSLLPCVHSLPRICVGRLSCHLSVPAHGRRRYLLHSRQRPAVGLRLGPGPSPRTSILLYVHLTSIKCRFFTGDSGDCCCCPCALRTFLCTTCTHVGTGKRVIVFLCYQLSRTGNTRSPTCRVWLVVKKCYYQ